MYFFVTLTMLDDFHNKPSFLRLLFYLLQELKSDSFFSFFSSLLLLAGHLLRARPPTLEHLMPAFPPNCLPAVFLLNSPLRKLQSSEATGSCQTWLCSPSSSPIQSTFPSCQPQRFKKKQICPLKFADCFPQSSTLLESGSVRTGTAWTKTTF